MINYTVD